MAVLVALLQACGGGGHDDTAVDRTEVESWTVVLDASFADDESLPTEWVQILSDLGFRVVDVTPDSGRTHLTLGRLHASKMPNVQGLLDIPWAHDVLAMNDASSGFHRLMPVSGNRGSIGKSVGEKTPALLKFKYSPLLQENICYGFNDPNIPEFNSHEEVFADCVAITNAYGQNPQLGVRFKIENVAGVPSSERTNGQYTTKVGDIYVTTAAFAGVWQEMAFDAFSKFSRAVCPAGKRVVSEVSPASNGTWDRLYWCEDEAVNSTDQPPETESRSTDEQSGMCTPNPIIPASGEKFFHFIDVGDEAPHKLNFERSYRTEWQIAPQASMGALWAHNHSANLRLDPSDSSGNTLILQLNDGSQRWFRRTSNSSTWTNDSHADQLIASTTSGGTATWRYTRRADDSQWQFTQPTASNVGQLQSQRQRDGWTYTYSYNAAGRLEQVRNQFNRALGLSYHPSGLLASVTGPDGKVTGYAWDASSRLTRVTFSDAKYITYHYEDDRFPQFITGITDENGKRYQSVSYDSLGRAEVSTLAGNADKYTVSYGNSTGGLNRGATITDPIGTARSFGYAQTNGHTDVTSGSNLPGCKGEPPIATRSQNPSNGLLEREVDFKGNVTQYTWDSTRQLIRSVTRAAGTSQQQVTVIDWHASLALPVLVTEPLKKTQYDYDADGRLQKVSVTHTGGQTPNKVQTTQYTYTSAGLLETRTEPNGAMTRYANHNVAGLPQTITNAIGHVTTVAYDAMGRPTSITQPDGLVRTLDYENRGWLKLSSETANGVTLTTLYTYTPSGQVKTITRPNGHVITYEHDDAQRVTGWSDNRGQSATYILDGLGNITAEQIRNSGGATALQIGRSINAINRLANQTQGNSVITTYGYDANGRLETIKDAANHTTVLGRDALARVSSITDALGRVAQLGYNGQDALTSASDFKGIATTFAPDAQGQPAAETSSDAGNRSATFDALNLPTSVTDSLGRASAITRDLLGRPTLITHSQSGEPTLATELRYDLTGAACNASGHPNASKGRLCEVIHKEGDETQATTQYQWDAFGRQTHQTQILSSAIADHSTVQNTAYSYVVSGAGAGELASISYPSGSVLTHQYGTAGQLSGMLWNGQPLLENIRFNALGQPLSWTWAFADSSATTTLGASRTYNTAGQLTSSEFASYVPNALGQIEGMTQGLYRPDGAGGWALESVPMTVVYNEMGQLTGFAAAGTSASTQRSHGYGYDTNGNRVSNYQSGPAGTNQTTTSTIASDSNRLSQHAGQEVQTNAVGEIERLENKVLRYDAAGRLTTVESSCNTTASNRLRCPMMVIPPTISRYNGLNQRIQRDNSRQHSVYVYGPEPHTVLTEIHRDLRTSVLSTTEHVYLPTASGPMPVAAVIGGVHYAVHSDHLNTPRRLSDASGQAKWQWAYSGFGEVAAQSLPASSQAPLPYNLRYPGQVDDGNGLFYNFHRFYHPGTGRYTQVDPIGLEGGWNRYSYVGGGPLGAVDPEGLQSRGAPPPQLTYSGSISAVRVTSLLNQIRQYNPSYTYSSVRASRGPGSEYTNADVASLMGILRGYQNPQTCSRNGVTVGQFIADRNGNVMVEPVGGSTGPYPPHRPNSPDTHTYYPNGSNYMRINPQGHGPNTTPHGHGHLPGTGTGRSGQGSSTDIFGNPVPSNSGAAHWPIY